MRSWQRDQQPEYTLNPLPTCPTSGTSSNQLVLFEQDTTPMLVPDLRKQFQGKGAVTGQAVREFVENRTAYLKTHMTAALRQEEPKGGIKVDPKKTNGKRRKANSYPDDVVITFL